MALTRYDALKKQLAQPGTYQELGFEERLSLLTAEELTCRENRKAERLIKHARFRLNAELSKLDYRNNRGLDRALIRSLSQGNWLTLKQNILLTGATGSGKTFLACALGHNACRQGYKVYYYRLKALMEQCYQGHADGRYSKLLTRLNNSDLLLLDDHVAVGQRQQQMFGIHLGAAKFGSVFGGLLQQGFRLFADAAGQPTRRKTSCSMRNLSL